MQACSAPTSKWRRVWTPYGDNVHSEWDPGRLLYVYYLKPPGSYILEMIVDWDNISASAIAEGCSAEVIEGMKNAKQVNTRPIRVEAKADGKGGFQIPHKYTLGRHYQDIDGVPNEARRWFSRKHCSILWHFQGLRLGEACFMLQDFSSNGTYLNSRIVPPKQEVPLMDGDVIGVSMTEKGSLMVGYRFRVVFIFCFVRENPPVAWSYLQKNCPLQRLHPASCRCIDCVPSNSGEPFVAIVNRKQQNSSDTEEEGMVPHGSGWYRKNLMKARISQVHPGIGPPYRPGSATVSLRSLHSSRRRQSIEAPLPRFAMPPPACAGDGPSEPAGRAAQPMAVDQRMILPETSRSSNNSTQSCPAQTKGFTRPPGERTASEGSNESSTSTFASSSKHLRQLFGWRQQQ